MNLKERLKKDRETINTLKTKKEKILFLWDYYKVPIVSVILVLVIVIPTVLSNIGKKPVVMYTVLLNTDSKIVEVDKNIFINELIKNNNKFEGKEVDVNDYLTLGQEYHEEEDGVTLQVLNALFSITDLDLYVSEQKYFDMFAQKGAFCDLSLLIDKELLSRHVDDLYRYVNDDGVEIVGGIILHEGSIIHEAGYYHDDVIIGAVSNGAYLENAIVFISSILSD